ncbi:hypothetical protein [Streptomyces sp. NPDC005760]
MGVGAVDAVVLSGVVVPEGDATDAPLSADGVLRAFDVRLEDVGEGA